MFTMRTSLHGRKFGISSTGGLITKANTSVNSTVPFELAAQMWGEGQAESVSASSIGSTISNSGVTTLTTSTGSTEVIHEIFAPVPGVRKTIVFATTAEALSLGGTSTAIIFRPASAGGGSTLRFSSTYVGEGGSSLPMLSGLVLEMVGVSTAEWAVTSGRGSSIGGYRIDIG